MKKRLSVMLLALVLLLGMLPTAAMAADGAAEQAAQIPASQALEQTGYGVPVGEGEVANLRLSTTEAPTQEQAYQRIIAMKETYPEGMRWTNDNFYEWNGGIFAGGYGCAGFAFLLSDAAFGDLPARMSENISYDKLKVGDILRINNDTHSVIILQIYSDKVVIAEGNYNSSIHWGRTLTKAQVLQSDYVMTRYPCDHTYVSQVVPPTCKSSGYTLHTCTKCGYQYQDNFDYTIVEHDWDDGVVEQEPTATEEGYIRYTCRVCGWEKTEVIPAYGEYVEPFVDVPVGKYYSDAVLWAVEHGVTEGVDATHFQPNAACTRAQVVTFLWRAMGSPEPTITSCDFVDVEEGRFYYKAMLWAVENGITTGMDSTHFAPDGTVTRGQFVTFLWRAEGKPASSGDNPFTDLDINSFYYEAVLWAAENGITTGITETEFMPENPCTRGQVVTFLYRDLA